ncbi:GNAT family N-acetyltransferase [Kitasatospora sp. NPDC048540]|uniref:GNAT family N-acetyltransferase n=1 Tax=Kitasatospora sp. NPDC048540 TaxID=3155634 RepID=UPI0033ED2350
MEIPGRLELANDNAAAFQLAQAEARGWLALRRPGFAAVRPDRGPEQVEADRVVVTRPYADPSALEAELVELFKEWDTGHLCLEDPYGRLDLSRFGCEAARGKPVMARPPGPPDSDVDADADAGANADAGRRRYPADVGLTVHEVIGVDDLAEAERTVVHGFPELARLPWQRGGLFPAALLERPGYRVWLARRGGTPASACVTYDDGAAVGVYWVATLPEHRSKGAAGAVIGQALAAHPDRLATLTATESGEPLYRRMGFREQGVSRWWRYPRTVPAASSAAGPR